MVATGVRAENIVVVDSKGVVHAGREGLDPSKQRYARKTDARTLADAVKGADVFLGCSAAGVLTPAMVATMAERPIILALANPEPEIRPELAKQARPDCIVATGRSDYPNQVNNVLCFPYIFRGALDAGATSITDAMKLACVREIAALAKEEVSDEVAMAYAGQELAFGPDYIIPKPFDTRLIMRIAPAVAEAAQASGVATRPIADIDAYRDSLAALRHLHGDVHAPGVRGGARPADAGDLRRGRGRAGAARGADGAGRGTRATDADRPARQVIAARVRRAGLRFEPGEDVPVVDPENDPRFREYWTEYHALMGRRGVTPEMAKAQIRRSTTTIGAIAVRRGDADAMICGMVGRFDSHLENVRDVIGLGARPAARSRR